MSEHDAIAHRIYDADPSLSPISHKPLSLSVARSLGTSRAALADMAAAREIEDGAR